MALHQPCGSQPNLSPPSPAALILPLNQQLLFAAWSTMGSSGGDTWTQQTNYVRRRREKRRKKKKKKKK